tara:strand:+ start:258 stop:611 length:354 start_codon:yes stop_codon:yes gene_type:complete
MNKSLNVEELLKKIKDALNDLKAIDIQILDIQKRTSLADYMVIADGNSSRHVNSIVTNLCKKLKKHIISIEGTTLSEWALIDFGDIILHVFKPTIREIYNLEKIWSDKAPDEKKKFG